MAILKNTTINGTLAVNGDLNLLAKDNNQVYDVAYELANLYSKINIIQTNMNKFQCVGFSIVRTNKSNSSTKIASLAKMQSIFNSGCNVKNCGAVVMNGDGNATDAHFDTVTWVGTDLYVAYNKSISVQNRITGFLWYYTSTILDNNTLSI